MKYIRTKDKIIDLSKVTIGENGWKSIEEYITFKQDDQQEPIKIADTVEELIQVGDIVFYWMQSDDTERCEVIVREDDVRRIRFNTITKLLIPVGENYMCVAKAYPVFVTFENRRYLQMKGELKLL